jgi:uracil permease
MKLVYKPQDRPSIGQTIVFAIQQLLAIMAATLVVPIIVGHGMSPAAALFGAGVGTIVYQLFTKFRSPVFLGSSFAFLGSMAAAFAGGVSVALGYLGLIIGAIFAGLVYVIISFIVKKFGVAWINKLMPPEVIGPTVAIIGLSLAGNAISDLQKGDVTVPVITDTIINGVPSLNPSTTYASVAHPLIAILCGLIPLAVVIICSAYGKKMVKLIPFIIGIGAGYVVALIFTTIGVLADVEALQLVDFNYFKALVDGGVSVETFLKVPDFTFIKAFGAFDELSLSYVGTIAVAYAPVAFVVFAEHISDHKNLSSIIDEDLLENPGLSRTLLGDGVGSMAGAFFGGCPNTTYGESVACVAITGNASTISISFAAIGALLISFLSPFVALVDGIPACVMGGVCIALYGFIAVSGLKMIQKVDLGKNKNLFTVSTILVCGIGGLALNFGKITITAIATALILGILVNILLSRAPETKE